MQWSPPCSSFPANNLSARACRSGFSRGLIFGIPHDVHPVLLAYRADWVEAEGIDLSQIETWEDFYRVLSPMMRDLDGDGRADRYLLSGWSSALHLARIFHSRQKDRARFLLKSLV